MVHRTILFALVAAASASPALADWKGRGELGLVFTSGNTDTDSANFRFDVHQSLARWKNELGLSALRSTAEGFTNAQRYAARAQTNYGVNEGGRNFWFAGLRYDDDRFSGFDYQASASSGYRRVLVDSEHTKFSAQIGAGYRQLRNSLTGVKEDDAIGTADVNFVHAFTENAKIGNRLTSEAGSENVFVENRLTLDVQINHSFALSVGYGVRYNSEPPPGLRSTDTLSTANLVYSFH